MSGHSKWANIHVRKGIADKKRSSEFTRLAKKIMVAIRQGGGADVVSNSALRVAIEQAREGNMPKENIARLLLRWTQKGESMETFWVEAFGPDQWPMMIEVETDNRNRAVAEVRSVLKNNGGVMAEIGSVGFMFEKLWFYEWIEGSPEDSWLDLVEIGAEDVDNRGVWVRMDDKKAFDEGIGSEKYAKFKLEAPRMVMRLLANYAFEAKPEMKDEVESLVASLEELEDVVEVFWYR